MGESPEPAYIKTINALNERYLIDVSGVHEIWLVRHADSYRGLADGSVDPADPPLSPFGQAQVVSLADRLAGISFQAVWSSPARRAVQTATAVAERHGLPVQTDPRLREIRNQWDEDRTSTLRPEGSYPFPEPEDDVAERMRLACDAVVATLPSGGPTPVRSVVVGHDAAMLLYLTHTLGLRWGQLRTMLCLTSVSVVAYLDGRAVVRSFGDVSHLTRDDLQLSHAPPTAGRR